MPGRGICHRNIYGTLLLTCVNFPQQQCIGIKISRTSCFHQRRTFLIEARNVWKNMYDSGEHRHYCMIGRILCLEILDNLKQYCFRVLSKEQVPFPVRCFSLFAAGGACSSCCRFMQLRIGSPTSSGRPRSQVGSNDRPVPKMRYLQKRQG